MSVSLNTLADLGIMLLLGIFMGRLAKHLRLPNVTGYLVAGLLLGPYFLPAMGASFSVLSETFVSSINVLSEIALGFIAFSIGNEFKLSFFKKVGATPIVIACLESFFAVCFVTAALALTGHNLSFSFVLGSIAAATAPAATIMVLNQYKAKGTVTGTLLSVVAIDDATALLLFSICVAIAKSLKGKHTDLLMSVLSPACQILMALGIGFLLGILLLVPMRFFHKKSNRLGLICGVVFLGLGLADLWGLSTLLLLMACGAAVSNFSDEADAIMDIADSAASPVFILFFVASGAGLQVKVLGQVGLIGFLYIIFRFAGKWFGAWLGAKLCHADRKVRVYLGPCLLPQAGVAIGLMMVGGRVLPDYAAQIRAVVLAGTLIFELTGPAVTKLCLTKAGEISRN